MGREKRPLWAILRDTHGYVVPSTVPLSALLSAHPNLRALSARELAARLEVSEREADRAIEGYVADAVPAELRPRAPGASVDERLALAGRPADPSWMNDRGPRTEAGGFNNTPSGLAAAIPLGFAYRMPARFRYDADAMAAYLRFDGSPFPTPIAIDAPTGYDVQQATCLRQEIPSDPNDPTLPHPDWIRAFCFAMTPGGAGLVTNMNGELAANPGGLAWDGTAIEATLASYARGAHESDPEWPRPLPGEGWNLDAIRKAYDAFKWYGPLPADNETPDGKLYYDGWPDGVTRERYVFWYMTDDDGNWNRCMQVQGWNGTEWILPTKWGEAARAWLWRPTDGSHPNTVGEWKVFFSFDNWVNENKGTFAVVAFWVSSILITVSTFGAGAATLAAAATISAMLIACQKLYSALAANDPAKAVAACVELGKAMNDAAGGDLGAAIKKSNPGLANFAESVAAPFQKIYQAAGGAIKDIYALWDKAQALKGQLPVMGQVAWVAATSALGGVGGPLSGPAAWLQMARLPTTSDVANELWANAPEWAKDVVALGLSLSAAELAQASGQAKSLHMGSVIQYKGGGGGGGALQISAPIAQGIRTVWEVPKPAEPPAVPSFSSTPANAPPGAGGAAVVVAAAAAGGIAWAMGLFR